MNNLNITNKCVGCSNCQYICPVNAIYFKENKYHIDLKKCCNCNGFYNKPKCIDVCPVNCIKTLAK